MSLRQRLPLLLLETSNLVGGVSNALAMIVIPWLILERTGSAAAAGVAGALTGVPGIVISPLVGTLVDHLGRKTVSVGADILSALSVLLFPIADALGRLDLAVILILTFLGAVFDPAGYTARKALIPDVAARSGVGVDHVNGIHEGVFAAGWVIGPVIAAAGIAIIGPVDTMWIATAAFLLAALTVWLLSVPNKARPEPGAHAEPRGHFLRSTGVGIKALVSDRPVWVLTVAVAVLSLIYMPTESVLLPVHFEAVDQPEAFGLTMSLLAAGGMLGAFGYGWIARRMTRYQVARWFMTIACIAFAPMALLPPLPVFLVSAFLLGLAWGPMNPLLNSLVQDRFPAQQHGRIYGVQLALFYAAPPLGQLVSGIGVERAGIEPVFIAVAVLLVVTALVVDLMPSLRGLDDRKAPA